MTSASILLIARPGNRAQSHISSLQKRFNLQLVSSGREAISAVQNIPPDIIILDAASMNTPGERICRSLREAYSHIPILHIVPEDAKQINSPADILLVPPFGVRRLTNNINRLIETKYDEIITCGPYTMNVPRRILMSVDYEAELTPKVALLLEVFFRSPMQIFDRKTLMEKVWQTDYLGDTRTLDVHIRWLREALEANGRFPRYLKTVRGIGYRLELPSINKAKS